MNSFKLTFNSVVPNQEDFNQIFAKHFLLEVLNFDETDIPDDLRVEEYEGMILFDYYVVLHSEEWTYGHRNEPNPYIIRIDLEWENEGLTNIEGTYLTNEQVEDFPRF